MMGNRSRKIRSKKRKRSKDVLNMIEKRNSLMKDKTNKPPRDPKFQDIPKSLKEFIKLKALSSTDDLDCNGRKGKKSAHLARNSTSTERSIRISQKTEDSLPVVNDILPGNDSDCEDVDDDGGEVSTVTRQAGPTGFINRQEKRKKKKLQKFRLRQKLKEIKRKEQLGSNAEENKLHFIKDSIKFGEVVHRPPDLSSARPRKVALTGNENRPGRKDDLLLKSIMSRRPKIARAKEIVRR